MLHLWGKGPRSKKCPEQKKNESDDSVTSTTSSKKSIEELEKRLKSANMQFTQLKAQLEDDEGLEPDNLGCIFPGKNTFTLKPGNTQ